MDNILNIENDNDIEKNEKMFNTHNLLLKKFYFINIDNLRYILKFYISKNSEFIILCHFYDTNEDTVFFSASYSLPKLQKIHKIFKIFTNIDNAIDQLILIFNENYPQNISLKAKEFSYDILELSCSFIFLNKKTKDEIHFDLNNIGINKPNIDEYILYEIYNLKNKKNKKLKEIEILKLQNRLFLERINILEKKLENNYPLNENTNFNSNKINSNILIKKDLDFLKSIFSKKYNINDVYFNLIYRATRDGEKVSDFHKICDNIPRTLVIIKTIKGVKIGGYTEQTWLKEKKEKNEKEDYKKDNNAFIVSLDKFQIYNIKPGENAIWCHPLYGPCFYGKKSFSIYIKDYLLTEPLITNKLIDNNYNGIKYDYELFNGVQKTYAQDIEVFQVIMN